MTFTDAFLPALAACVLTGLFLLAYRKDIADARLFAAMRRAATHPYADRDWHRHFARRHKLFWGPCPLCQKPFGGHEMTGKTVPDPDPLQAARGVRKPVCPPCSLTLRSPATPGKHIKQYAKTPPKRGPKH